MNKPATTHVIEIETGIGEPAFIPLTMGQELQPISVGKKGMWRIESARVLDVHAFVYFDGTSLFLQSAEEASSAAVDGQQVGTAWTELHAPCKIEIGAARLRFRSLTDAGADEVPTANRGKAPGLPPPPPPPRPAPSASPQRAEEPMSFPKQDRGYVAGGYNAPVEESTRIGPVDTNSRAIQAIGSVSPRPAAGRNADEQAMETRMENGPQNLGRTGGMPGAPVQAIPQSQHPPGLQQPPPMLAHQMQSTMPQNLGTGGYGALGGPNGPPPNMNMGSGAYGTVNPGDRYAPTVVPPPEGSIASYQAKYRELSPPKRILVILAPFCLLASAYLLLFDDDAPAPTAANADAGTEVATQPTAPATQAPTVMQPAPLPPNVQCQPGMVPFSVPVNGQYFCVPAGTPMPVPEAGSPISPPTSTGSSAGQPPPFPAAGTTEKPAPQPPPDRTTTPAPTTEKAAPAGSAANAKSLERQAVDAVAVNDYARAAAIYETLGQQNPQNRVYAEAARILRAKAAGTGGGGQ